MSVRTLPAVLLRAHPYSETSRILRFLTPELGVVATMARGVRARGGKGTGGLETFAQGELTLDLKPGRDLQGFRDFRPGLGDPRRLGRGLLPFAAASYLAELVLAHQLEEESPTVFALLLRALDGLETGADPELPGYFLAAGWGIVAAFGFPPELEACIRCGVEVEEGVAAEGQRGAGSGGRAHGGVGAGSGEEGGGPVFPRFDLGAGGLRCPACSVGGEGPRVGEGARAALRGFLTATVEEGPEGGRSQGGSAPGAVVEGAAAHFTLLDRFARLHLGLDRPFRSEALLRGAFEPRSR